MGKPSPPPAPDYVGAANAQGQANIAAGQQTASLGNPNVTNPYGSQTVNYTPTGPNGDLQPNITQSLNPQAQQTLDAQQRVQTALAGLGEQGVGQAQRVLGTPFNPNLPNLQTGVDMSGVPKMPVNPGMTGQQSLLARLNPQINQSNAAMEQQLRNQGLVPGGEAYDNAKRIQNQSNNDLISQAGLYGIGLDTQANQQGFNEALQQGQFGNQAIGQSLAQQLGLYNQPLNQITALMSGSQVQNPTFQGYTGANIGAAPIANATSQIGQYNQNLYNQQMGSYNNMVSGLFDLGGAVAGAPFMSDVRLKSNIVKVADHPGGFGVYEYDIDGRHERGVLAQEVEKVKPEAVVTMPNGYKAVYYGML